MRKLSTLRPGGSTSLGLTACAFAAMAGLSIGPAQAQENNPDQLYWYCPRFVETVPDEQQTGYCYDPGQRQPPFVPTALPDKKHKKHHKHKDEWHPYPPVVWHYPKKHEHDDISVLGWHDWNKEPGKEKHKESYGSNRGSSASSTYDGSSGGGGSTQHTQHTSSSSGGGSSYGGSSSSGSGSSSNGSGSSQSGGGLVGGILH